MEYKSLTELRTVAKEKGIKNAGRKSEKDILEEMGIFKNKEEIKEISENFELRIKTNGWCEELQMSYFEGVYLAKNKKEYEILKKYLEL